MRQTTPRPGFTLLEVILALAISTLLLAALYVALNLQLHHAQAGRDTVEHSTLVRVLFNRLNTDVASGLNLADPARFRTPAAGSSGTSATTTSSDAVVLPMGVQGDNGRLTLYLSRVPKEVYGAKPADAGQLTSDLRRVTYWLAADGGLARQEVLLVTSADADPSTLPVGGPDEKGYVIAPEVRGVAFSYFDGTAWQTSWDATTPGTDGVTPVGPPRAVAVEVDVARPTTLRKGDPQLVHYRHVVAVGSANGATQQGGGTSP